MGDEHKPQDGGMEGVYVGELRGNSCTRLETMTAMSMPIKKKKRESRALRPSYALEINCVLSCMEKGELLLGETNHLACSVHTWTERTEKVAPSSDGPFI